MFKKEVTPEAEKLIAQLEALSKTNSTAGTILECADYFRLAGDLTLEEALTKAIKVDMVSNVIKFGFILGAEERQTYYKLADLEEITLRSES